jgi:hypothetical protein
MTRSAYNLHRLFAALLLLLSLFAIANYYLELGFLGQRASKGILILAIGVTVIYGAFFSPTREDMDEHKRPPR